MDLQAQIEAYKIYTGFYPESVHVEQIYRTRSTEHSVKREELE